MPKVTSTTPVEQEDPHEYEFLYSMGKRPVVKSLGFYGDSRVNLSPL
jgi:hypothetical protein